MIFRLLASFTHKDNVRCKHSGLFSCMGEFNDSANSEGASLWHLPLKWVVSHGEGCICTSDMDRNQQSGTRQRPNVQAQEYIYIAHRGHRNTATEC